MVLFFRRYIRLVMYKPTLLYGKSVLSYTTTVPGPVPTSNERCRVHALSLGCYRRCGKRKLCGDWIVQLVVVLALRDANVRLPFTEILPGG
jgi:hypothetical protein